jgi:hypothetical protein
MVKVRFVPWVIVTFPEGEIVPPLPADDAMVYVAGFDLKLADIVWFALTFVKV